MITLTEQEANELLSILHELPIKYLRVVQDVQQYLAEKFQAVADEQKDAQ